MRVGANEHECCCALSGSATAYGSAVALRAVDLFGTAEAVPFPNVGCAPRVPSFMVEGKRPDEVNL